jgi:hypothetical protein
VRGPPVVAKTVNTHSVRWPYLVLLSVLAVFVPIYQYLSFSSWFFQDDFLFLREYRHSIQPDQILSFTNFGRFLSRNLYWFVMAHTFGGAAQPYYFVNLAVILNAVYFIYLFFVRLSDRKDFSVVVSLIYCLSGPVLHSYSWISNIQHLLAHLLVFMTLWLWMRLMDREELGVVLGAAWVMMFLLGLFANVLYGFVLVPLGALTITQAAPRQRRGLSLLLAVGLVLFVLFMVNIPIEKGGPYQARINVGVLATNLNYYAGLFHLRTSMALAGVSALTLLFVSRRQGIGLMLLATAVAFYSPFAFMVFQRYPNYIALSAFFVLAATAYGLLIVTRPRPRLFVVTAVPLIAWIASQAALSIAPVLANPVGAAERTFLEKLAAADLGRSRIVCFRGEEAVVNTTGVASWDIPVFWWRLGFGAAFDGLAYMDGHRRVHLYGNDPRCRTLAATIVSVRLVNDKYSFTIGTPSRVPSYTIGTDVAFHEGGDGVAYQAAGWSDPEASGCWTDGKTATLAMRLEDEARTDLILHAIVMPFLGGGRTRLTADVLVNGVRVAQWTLAEASMAPARARIPAGLLKQGGDLEIAFHIANPDSPVRLGLSGDTRLLGLNLAGLRLERAGP